MSSPYSKPLTYPFASSLFALNTGSLGYLIPKPKFMYYVQFIIKASYQLSPSEWNRVGYLVKSVERPKFQYKTQELDQYNRKRVIQTKVAYSSLSMTFHDPVDGVMSKMIDDYNRHNFGDFNNMVTGDGSQTHDTYWGNTTIQGNDAALWGYRLKNPNNWFTDNGGRGLPTSENFFEEIRVYEFYGNKATRYTLMNPTIDSISFDNNDSASSEGNEVTISFNPEGIVYNFIDAFIDSSAVASSILPGPGFSTNNFPISQPSLSDMLLGGVIRAGGALLSNMVNGVFGSFGSLNGTFNDGIGLIGGAAITAASSGLLGNKIYSYTTPTNLFLANTFVDAFSQQQVSVFPQASVYGLGTINSLGSSAVSLASSTVATSVNRVSRSISSLF